MIVENFKALEWMGSCDRVGREATYLMSPATWGSAA